MGAMIDLSFPDINNADLLVEHSFDVFQDRQKLVSCKSLQYVNDILETSCLSKISIRFIFMRNKFIVIGHYFILVSPSDNNLARFLISPIVSADFTASGVSVSILRFWAFT